MAAENDQVWWRAGRAWPLVAVGIVLVTSGFVHVAVWGALGGPWEGPVTWRKPILFGISGGLTSLSLGWAFARVTSRWGDVVLAWATAVALVVEVALIDLQRWRGVASHFNRGTPLDSALYDVMGGLILVVTLVCVDLTVRLLWRAPAGRPADMVLAARAGFVLLAVSCVLGIWASVHGDVRSQTGLAPETFGAAGVVKFPHGAVIHAVQWLPALAWAANRAGIATTRRVWLVATAALGSVFLLGYALAQTLLGRGRFDAPPALTALLAAAIACLAVPAVVVAEAWIRAAFPSRDQS
ncbi:MAG: hypothetical protein ACKOSQ_03480 [Planctomycetaceae bacterium]